MTNIDYMLAGGLVLLLLIVVLRIYLGRRKQAEEFSGITFKEPRKSSGKGDKKADSIEPSHSEPAAEIRSAEASYDDHASKNPSHEKFQTEAEDFPQFSPNPYAEDIEDPITIIKTFSAPKAKRIMAIQEAGARKLIAAVPALIEALYEPDSSISLAASESLGEIGDPRAIEPLLEVSRRSDAMLLREMPGADGDYYQNGAEAVDVEVSDAAANPYNFKEMVVFKIDQLPQEYFMADGSPIPRKDLVIKGLKDNNQQMRQMAAKAAIGLEHDDVVDPLIAALSNPFEVESVRFLAAEALGGMQSDKSIESLLGALKDENVAVRYSAAAALSGNNDERVILALIEAINDPDRYVRSSIAYALGASNDARAMNILFSVIADESEVVRFSAAKAIACFPADEILEEITMRMQNADRFMLISMLEVLGQIKDERSIDLLRHYLKNDDSEISYKASTALLGQESEDIIDDLIQASRRIDEELLQLMRDNMGRPLFPGKIKSTGKNETTSGGFSRSLDSFTNLPPNLEKLRKSLMDQSPNIRGTAANTLGDFVGNDAVALLAAVRNDTNEFVRSSVVTSLGKIGSVDALELIVALEGDASEEVRYAVVKALSGKSGLLASECLKRIAAGDKAKNVKRAARQALEKS